MTFLLSSNNVFDYLVEKDLCNPEQKSMSQIELKPAKNFNLLLSLPDRRQLLIKQERPDRHGKTAGEFFREWQLQTLLRQFPELRYIRPCFSEAIYFDAESSILVFNYLNEYRDLADFYGNGERFATPIATAIGSTLATIHCLSFDRTDYRDFFQSYEAPLSPKPFELIRSLKRLTPDIFGTFPADGLRFFSLYQRYDSLGQAIAELCNTSEPCCLTHNDLKLNNILLANNWEEGVPQPFQSTNSLIRLIDWEQSAWGDPAIDLGMLIASYLQCWLYSLITSKKIALEDSLRLATIPLEKIQPSMAALARAYITSFPKIFERRPDFLPRVVQFSGLALIQSILATLQHEKTFGNAGICMLQVAKSLLCRPEQSIPTVFGMDAVEFNRPKVLRLLK